MQSISVHSYLFVPGNRPDRFAKACAAGADAVIVDLEDAVSPADKHMARAAASNWLASAAQPVLIRVNGVDTPWFQDDLALCSLPGVLGIFLPKAENIEDIKRVGGSARPGTPILPIIETAKGFWNAYPLAQAPQVQRLAFGSIDLRVDLGSTADEDELLYFRSQLVLVSRVAGIESPVDGVTTAIDDAEKIRLDTLRAKRLGFGAKLCIHPRQISWVNQTFAPSAEEVAWARRVVEAAVAARGAAISVDGEMVDRPVVALAEAVLRRSAKQG